MSYSPAFTRLIHDTQRPQNRLRQLNVVGPTQLAVTWEVRHDQFPPCQRWSGPSARCRTVRTAAVHRGGPTVPDGVDPESASGTGKPPGGAGPPAGRATAGGAGEGLAGSGPAGHGGLR